ncbi:LysR family transcriptional regulator [Pseudomonas sp. TKO26]|uniref:LysR substrate-binding domain-containing protein n=1 Tax=Pseudomonas TaxID=286 RepID=UPI000D843532|nr:MULTISPECIES: LysR substrate-binding domain-containing protein [Pseudomonas]PYY92007.1 LysR family transcriptional regulator [Pseudomonas sp. TKO30]PYY94370.1 LysR family transcriptional regulator [Pseudomonas sp. TKO29]PYY96243.1 LysR family transcriptional regulator [Pseudomonas sp. TKO26]PYZ01835.1 LysR family transcriptional regulator [Pseudomonas sp. TKO14]
MSRFARHLPPLETLVTFEAVGRNASFTRAATELCLTQSAVSKQIRALELSLKTELFERQARGVKLTASGASLFAEVSTQLEALLRSVSRLRAGRDANTITVQCTHAVAQFWLFPRLLAFNKQHPEITVSIHANNDMDESSVAEHDFGILYGAGHWSSLAAVSLFDEVVYPIVSRHLALPEVSELVQLAELPLIQLDASAWNCIDWRDWFRHFGLDYSAPPGAMGFNQLTLMFSAVQQGMGVGLGWDFMASQLVARGELQRVGQWAFRTGQADYLVHPRHKRLSASGQLFRDWLVAQAVE